MRRGDIYFASLDPTLGHEQQGARPLLIVSSDDFNRLTKLPVTLPITTGGQFARQSGYAVSLLGSGLQTTGVVRCDQPRVVDLLARKPRFVEQLRGPILADILDRTMDLFA